MNATNTLRAVRLSAAYDLAVTWPLALPGAQGWMHGLLGQAHERLGLSGSLPAMDPLHQFFAGLLGALVVVWALVRWRAPGFQLGRWDVVSRLAFAAWQVGSVLQGLTPLLLVFSFFELLFAWLQRGCFSRAARASPASFRS